MTDEGAADAHHHEQIATVRRAGRRQSRSPLLAAVGGFVLGAVVWHFVGFWNFMSGVVLHGPESTRGGSATSGPVRSGDPTTAEATNSGRLTPSRFRAAYRTARAGAGASCSAAAIDRSGGTVSIGSCLLTMRRFALQSTGRGDRRTNSPAVTENQRGGWIVQVDARRDN